MKKQLFALVASLATSGAVIAQWDSVIGESSTIDGYDRYWVSARSGDTVFLVDAESGEVGGTLIVSSFTPAIAPHMDTGRIYSYGSFYSRGSYGNRTDWVTFHNAETAAPVGEVEIPARSAGIGHPGMIGLINNHFVGVWNITPATSVSLVDTQTGIFIGEISMPSCSGIYPEARGWISLCGDGRALYIELNQAGQEERRVRSEPFFEISEDPVYDYSVPAADGWMLMSFDGMLRKVTLNADTLGISESFNINPESDGVADINGVVPPADDNWRIGGYQPFAYHDGEALLVTLMHEGGGQETFEKAGTEIWGFNMRTGKRGYRISLGEDVQAGRVLLTPGEDPLMVLSTDDGLQVREPRSGRLLHTVENASGTIQSLYEGLR